MLKKLALPLFALSALTVVSACETEDLIDSVTSIAAELSEEEIQAYCDAVTSCEGAPFDDANACTTAVQGYFIARPPANEDCKASYLQALTCAADLGCGTDLESEEVEACWDDAGDTQSDCEPIDWTFGQ